MRHPLIGIDPNDPYGRIMAGIFARLGLTYEVTIKARFGTMVCALVGRGLGIAVIDEFTLAAGTWPGIVALPIVESTEFQTYIAFRRDAILSSYCEHFIALAASRDGSAAWRQNRLRQKSNIRFAQTEVLIMDVTFLFRHQSAGEQ